MSELRRREARPAPRREELPRVNWEALDEFVAVHQAHPAARSPRNEPASPTEAVEDVPVAEAAPA